MWGDYSSIVWSVSESYFEHLMQISDEAFREELNLALMAPSEQKGSLIQDFLGNNVKVDPPYVYNFLIMLDRRNMQQKALFSIEYSFSPILRSR